MKRTAVLSLAAVSLVLACQSDQTIAPNPLARHPGISTALVDGGHGGNPHFFFLPPMVPPPPEDQPPPFSGTFDATLRPVVQICTVGTNGTCAPVAGSPFMTPPPGTPFNPLQVSTSVQVVPIGQFYFVLWNPNWLALDPTRIQRISVSVGSQSLGIADVKVVTSLAGVQAVWASNEFVPMLQGGPLLISFRIEQGAVGGSLPPQCNGQPDCVQVTLAPNTQRRDVVTPSGRAAVSFPPGYITQTVTLTIHQVVELPGQGCFSPSSPSTPYLVFGCYSYATSPQLVNDALGCKTSPSGTTCARVEVCPTLATSDPNHDHLELLRSDPDQPVRRLEGDAIATLVTCLPPIGLGAHGAADLARASWQSVESVMNALGGLLRPKPLFAATAMIHLGGGGLTCCFSNIGWALPLQMSAVSPTAFTGVSGARVSQPPTVLVQYLHNTLSPAAGGIPVTFSAAPGNGTVTNGAQLTDASGKASVGSWRLGTADKVPYTLVASGAVTAPVTFTAVGTTITGTVAETTPDALTGITGTIAPFLASATATAGGGNLTLSVTVGPNSFDPGTNHFIFNLDTDRNPSTGFPGVDAANLNATNMGTDYLVEMGSTSEGVVVVNAVVTSGGTARVLKYVSGSWTQVGTAPVTITTGTGGVLSTTIPLMTFGNSDGQMNFVVTAQTQYLPSNCPTGITICYTGIEDYLPNSPAVGSLTLVSP
jgi:hypothetical protein